MIQKILLITTFMLLVNVYANNTNFDPDTVRIFYYTNEFGNRFKLPKSDIETKNGLEAIALKLKWDQLDQKFSLLVELYLSNKIEVSFPEKEFASSYMFSNNYHFFTKNLVGKDKESFENFQRTFYSDNIFISKKTMKNVTTINTKTPIKRYCKNLLKGLHYVEMDITNFLEQNTDSMKLQILNNSRELGFNEIDIPQVFLARVKRLSNYLGKEVHKKNYYAFNDSLYSFNISKHRNFTYTDSFAERFNLPKVNKLEQPENGLLAISYEFAWSSGNKDYLPVLKLYLKESDRIRLPKWLYGDMEVFYHHYFFMKHFREKYIALSTADNKSLNKNRLAGSYFFLASEGASKTRRKGFLNGVSLQKYHKNLFEGITYIELQFFNLDVDSKFWPLAVWIRDKFNRNKIELKPQYFEKYVLPQHFSEQSVKYEKLYTEVQNVKTDRENKRRRRLRREVWSSKKVKYTQHEMVFVFVTLILETV